jgi:hypothetical protein
MEAVMGSDRPLTKEERADAVADAERNLPGRFPAGSMAAEILRYEATVTALESQLAEVRGERDRAREAVERALESAGHALRESWESTTCGACNGPGDLCGHHEQMAEAIEDVDDAIRALTPDVVGSGGCRWPQCDCSTGQLERCALTPEVTDE